MDNHRIGLIFFTAGVMDLALFLWIPFVWKYTLPFSNPIWDNPAAWIQSVILGATLTVVGGLIYGRKTGK